MVKLIPMSEILTTITYRKVLQQTLLSNDHNILYKRYTAN